MEEKNHIRTTLVSRLPKYGAKPAGNILQTVSNGTALNLSGNTQSIDKNFSKHNGTINMSSFSFNWRKSNKYQLGDKISSESSSHPSSNERLTDSEKCPKSDRAIGKEVLKLGSQNSFSKTAKQNNMFVSSSEELNQKSLPGLSSTATFTKSTLLGRTSYSALNAPKSHLNGICGNRSTVGLQRGRGNCTASRSSSGESLSMSIDNVKSSCEKMIRSQSFSHSIQSSLVPPASLTRSHSFNRAVDLTRPYQNHHLAIRTSQRTNLLSRSLRQLDVPNGNEPLRYGFGRTYSALVPPALKKQQLSNGSGEAPSLRFRTGRPSLLKPSNQHLGRKIPVDGSTIKDTGSYVVEDSVSINIAGGVGAGDCERTKEGESVYNNFGETGCKICMDGDVDEISISSLSSSEKNDLSEDFSDDFIDLEDPNRTIKIKEEDVPVQELDHGSRVSLEEHVSLKECEKTNSDEWMDRHVSADDRSESTKHPAGNDVISSDMDYRAGSSFELSPSDSSDGTYMWDEEGLEPIGSIHPCGSYDSSEMNSIDILNNLDSCDLEDDDLMLDVDLPEDTPCDNVDCENMNRYERQERNIRQQKEGLWKRMPQRWNAQDHYHLGHPDQYAHSKNDLNRSCNYLDPPPVGHLEGYAAQSLYPPLRSFPANTVMLDEMTLQHMVQDCTTVKTQLLKMKRILQQNDENVSLHNITLSLPSSPELQEPELIYKTEDLLNEITQLKEDLKKKDDTIKQLEHRLSIRCNCSNDSKPTERAMCTFADKFTQTSWRRSAPQILQPSSLLPRFTDITQGKLTKTSRIVAHSEHLNQDDLQLGGQEYQHAANGSCASSLDELSTLNTQLNEKKSEEDAHSIKNVKIREKPKDLTDRKMNTLHSHPSFSPSAIKMNARGGQTKPVLKSSCSRTNQALLPKTSRATKPPKHNALVPPSVPVAEAASSNSTFASKDPEQLPPSSAAQPQSVSSQFDLCNKSQRSSRLRPPTISFKPRPVTNPKVVMPQNPSSQINHSKQMTQAKENIQHQDSSVQPGERVSSNRQSRLPKPKTY